jgi:broad specificity phosphatase PhoE
VSDQLRPPPPPADRVDAPLYLARYREREALLRTRNGDGVTDQAALAGDDAEPLYLRRFRQRQPAQPASGPLWERASLAVQQALTEDNRNKEISAPAAARRTVVNDVYLIRHGETQGYSTDSGLTPQGVWQAHTYGHTLAKRIRSGETIVFRHAATNRARETAEQTHKGLLDGLAMFDKDVKVHEPQPLSTFRNFQFVAPDGLKDVTAAFRQYQSLVEGIERTAAGDRPLWLVEMDRFWRVQEGGGDPIQHWLTTPLMHFEPPSMCVRRFWAGLLALSSEFPGARLAIATHSGPIRAFAVAAFGYDPGEPYNTEHVRVKLLEGGVALVAYRNRVQEVRVPNIDQLPTWNVEDDWNPGAS